MDLPINYEDAHWSVRKSAREQYIIIQDGKCSHCGTDLKGNPRADIDRKPINKRLFPNSFFKWPVHLHHDHKTGLTIGAVHNKCNAVLWQYHGE